MKERCSRETVQRALESVLEFETDTRDLYEEYLNRLSDPRVLKIFRQLMDEEVQHVESVKAILEKIR